MEPESKIKRELKILSDRKKQFFKDMNKFKRINEELSEINYAELELERKSHVIERRWNELNKEINLIKQSDPKKKSEYDKLL